MTQKYELLADNPTCKGQGAKGDIVYSLNQWDYGLASDDTRVTGVDHQSVTFSADGDYPSFTVPRRLLRAVEK